MPVNLSDVLRAIDPVKTLPVALERCVNLPHPLTGLSSSLGKALGAGCFVEHLTEPIDFKTDFERGLSHAELNTLLMNVLRAVEEFYDRDISVSQIALPKAEVGIVQDQSAPIVLLGHVFSAELKRVMREAFSRELCFTMADNQDLAAEPQ